MSCSCGWKAATSKARIRKARIQKAKIQKAKIQKTKIRKRRSGKLGSALDARASVTWMGLIPNLQLVQVVAVRAIAGERGLVKQSLNAATQTNPVRASLHAQRPTHVPVPAAAHHHHGGSSHSRGNHSGGPKPFQPALFGFFGLGRAFTLYNLHFVRIRCWRTRGNSSLGPKALAILHFRFPWIRC
jgi:hypothetical protein